MLRNVYALWPHSVCTALDNHVQSYLGLIFSFVFGISLTYPSSQAGEDGSYKKGVWRWLRTKVLNSKKFLECFMNFFQF